jgi:hypothetical protein
MEMANAAAEEAEFVNIAQTRQLDVLHSRTGSGVKGYIV